MPRGRRRKPEYWRHKSFRDPLYGFIGITAQELGVIQSSPFQRLRRLKQLSHAYLVYPSAMHVRFEHSLGAMSVADRICLNLCLSDFEHEITRLAMLVHDIGHGPFSHLFEETMREINGEEFSHEIITSWIVNDDPEISKELGDCKEYVQTLLPAFQGTSDFPLLREIISSGLDADKLDYLRRDSYHVGVAYGSFDLERILHTISATPDRAHLCVLEKGKDSVENYRLGRYLMHAQVYEHHARLSADHMFLRAFELAIRDGAVDKTVLRIGSRKNAFAGSDHSNFLRYFLTLDDNSIIPQVVEAKGNAKKLVEDLYSRRLLKRAVELNPTLDVVDALKKKMITEMARKDLEKLEREIASEVGCDHELVIAHLQEITIKLYDPYDILVKRNDGAILTIDEVSPISASARPIMKLYVFCPSPFREKIRKATYDYFGLSLGS